MKPILSKLILTLLALVSLNAAAVTRYVDLNSPSPTPPYTSWPTAATNIQDAIDAADPGDEILVTNGVYQTGGVVVSPALLTNRVAVTKPLTLRSVNGADVTVIQGYQVPGTIYGTNAIRCVSLTNGAVLDGFTLTNGGTFTGSGSISNAGGGVFCETTNVLVLNCTLIGNAAVNGGGAYSGTLSNCSVLQNTATGNGGGAYNSMLRDCKIEANRAGSFGGGVSSGALANCIIANNNAASGGGSYNSALINSAIYGNYATSGGGFHTGNATNCTIVANSAGEGGGVFGFGGSVRLRNCIVYYNQAIVNPNGANNADVINCCVTPATGTASITSDPQLASFYYLSSASPCRTTGNATYASGTDIDGEFWASPPSIGCDQYISGSITGAVSVSIQGNFTNAAVGAAIRFLGFIDGRVNTSHWEFDDGVVVSNRPVVFHKWTSPGNRQVVLRAFNETHPDGVSATTIVQVVTQPIHYVRSNNPAQAFPYTSWATAATSIQNAVDAAAAVPGSLVLVSNGVYSTGVRNIWGSANRLVATNQVIVKAVNGPTVTRIVGRTPNGAQAIRCVYLGEGNVIDGFTLTSGATLYGSSGGIVDYLDSAGGVFCESRESIVTNCIVIENVSGGIYGGTVYGSIIATNSGGGAIGSTLNQCVIRSNLGGVYFCNVNNSLIISNYVYANQGAADYSTLNQCTVVGNAGGNGGASSSSLANCIARFNTPADVYFPGSFPPTGYLYNNSIGIRTGSAPQVMLGNFTTAPLFINAAIGDFRLQSNSPCINDGTNIYATSTTDLAGNLRIVGGAVDVGAYEHQTPAFQMPYRWLFQYGLAANSSSDSADTDGDGMNNYGEWRSDTIPTNALSVLKMVNATNSPTGAKVTWQSVSTRSYWLERATNLGIASPFQSVATNIFGVAGTKTFTDTSATNGGSYFYRVGVQ